MSEQEFNAIFAKNLTYYLYKSGHSQKDLAEQIGVSTASVSNWCKGIKVPRMDKVDKMCSFFNVKRADLIQEHEFVDPAATPQHQLLPDEAALLSNYQKLNDTGKEKAAEYIEDLTENEKYTKDMTQPSTIRNAG